MGIKYKFEEVKKYIELNSSCILPKQQYISNKSKLEVICGCGNIFYTSFEKFKLRNKKQCNNCTNKTHAQRSFNTFEYVKDYIESNNCILISNSYSGTNDELEIKCSCGRVFYRTFNNFKRTKHVCKVCSSSKSSGELKISSILNKMNINYEEQKTFEDLKSPISNYKLRYDFAYSINSKLVLIEYDGKQHFEPIEYFGGVDKFNQLKLHDSIKNKYADNNDYFLLRVSYNQIDDVENIISKFNKTILCQA